jgi:uncharacterized protein (DUF952 family)
MIYHVTTPENWEKAVHNGFYDAPSLQSEGFIHSSHKEQVQGVLERYYKDVTPLLLLHIDESKLTAPLIHESSPSINETFPHVYGSINLDAVIKTERL